MCLAATSGAREAICDTDLLEWVGWNERALALDGTAGGLQSVTGLDGKGVV